MCRLRTKVINYNPFSQILENPQIRGFMCVKVKLYHKRRLSAIEFDATFLGVRKKKKKKKQRRSVCLLAVSASVPGKRHGKGNRRGAQTETESIERKVFGELVGLENCMWCINSFCIPACCCLSRVKTFLIFQQ